MRRFVSLAVLLLFAVPFGASMVGCGHKTVAQFCAGDSGPLVGQVKSITLSPTFALYGESLNYGQMGTGLSASAVDCKGSAVSVRSYTYATTDMSFADINPATGVVCGGTFNRNVGGGIPDYTTCTAPVNPPANTVAYVTATADGAVSNAIPVYIHAPVTAVVLGNPTVSCPADPFSTTADPSTNCCPTGATITATPYNGMSCLSQGQSGQLVARIYKNGTTNPADNITCSVGHVNFSPQNASIFTIDQNGVVTAQQPGSTIVTASITNSGTGGAAGFFSTCPPGSITLTVPSTPAGTSGVAVNLNNTQPLVATVYDTNKDKDNPLGHPLTGLALTYNSTTPQTIPVSGGLVTPAFPGAATITATCQPPTCNPAPFSQIGLFGNGTPITSNGIQVTTAGTNATVIYIGSTSSQYILPVDFSTGQQGSLLKLPYTPNSMVISQDGSSIYLGSTLALMTVSALANSVTATSLNVPGVVLAVSPDGSTVVVTDPARQTVSLVNGGNVATTYGGVGTRAQFTPDSQTVFITTNTNQLLVHAAFTGWYSTPTTETYSDVTVTVPSVGAFFGGAITEGRSDCPSSVSTSPGSPTVVQNSFYPVANDTTTRTDRVAATNDGKRILGASAPTPSTASISDISITLPVTVGCPAVTPSAFAPNPVPPTYFGSSFSTVPLSGITATAITSVQPISTSALAFVTYTGVGGVLPQYVPAASGSGPGTVSYVTLSGGATSAPVTGVFATDNKTFYAGTSGDNQVHLISVNGTTAVDSSVIAPKLPDANGNAATPNLIVQRPKKSTS